MKGVLIWAFVCLILGFAGAYSVQRDIVTTGTDIKIKVSELRVLNIQATDKVVVTGGSSYFFVLYQKSGDTITANKTTPPLGWPSDEYYTVTQEMSTGDWIVAEGNVVINLTSSEPITTTQFVADKFELWAKFILATFLLFVIGLFIAI
jgi:hypothetical protein